MSEQTLIEIAKNVSYMRGVMDEKFRHLATTDDVTKSELNHVEGYHAESKLNKGKIGWLVGGAFGVSAGLGFVLELLGTINVF